MSNNVDATNMKQATKRELMPKLRFPEFGDAWAVKKLGDLGKLIGGGTPDKSVVEYWQGDIPWVSSSDIFEDDIYTMSVTRFINEKSISESATKIVPKGSVLFVSRVGTGKLAVNNNDVCTSQDFTNFLPKKIYNYFLGYFFIANKSALISLGQGTSIKGFSKGDLEKFEVIFPSPLEQQKIADCLSSIDELITAQTQKLVTLKTHKKGLMQQLFPAEGETLPKLRFPEFLDSGEWETKQLGELLLGHPDYGVNAAAVTYSEDLPAYLRITDISEEGYFLCGKKASVAIKATDEHYMSEGDIVLARTGASVGKSYKFRKEDGKLVFAGFLIRIKPDPTKIDSTFLFNFLFTEQYWNWVRVTSARSGQPGINGNEYAALLIPVPPHVRESGGLSEQQKIADCLSSIDELIAAQTHKLATLKTHKKGLMQQLFPALDEVQR